MNLYLFFTIYESVFGNVAGVQTQTAGETGDKTRVRREAEPGRGGVSLHVR